MSYKTILLDKTDHLATLTFNRPDRLNALNGLMFEERIDALDDIANDDDIRAMILTAAGRAFCASADVKEEPQGGDRFFSKKNFPEIYEHIRNYPQKVTLGIHHMPKPTIAAVNGLALGGGMEEAMDCDIRIASAEATFGLPEVKRGILAIYGIHHFARVTHFGEAMYYALTGETMSAEEARRIGFVHEVVPPERLMPRAVEIARAIAANAPLAVQATRKMMHFWRRLAMEESQKFGDVIYAQINQSEDAKEGPLAFTEKRPPQWKGR